MHLVVYGQPTRQFFRNGADASSGGTANVAKHSLLVRIGELSSACFGSRQPENANMAFGLENRAGEIVRLWPIPPLGARAALMDGDEVVFEGVVKGLTRDPVAVLTVYA
jgi:hypothetical protein